MNAVALPEIGEAFDVSAGQVTWLVSAYLIALAVAQPLGGRIGDQLGRGRVFRAGLLAFLGFSIGAAFAASFPVLVLFRTGQALTGAAVIPNGMAMLRASVPVAELGRTIGINGAVLSASAAAGPVGWSCCWPACASMAVTATWPCPWRCSAWAWGSAPDRRAPPRSKRRPPAWPRPRPEPTR
jgi:MFS family permease